MDSMDSNIKSSLRDRVRILLYQAKKHEMNRYSYVHCTLQHVYNNDIIHRVQNYTKLHDLW